MTNLRPAASKIAFSNRQTRAHGLVSECLQLSDATHLTARVNLFCLKQAHQDEMTATRVERNSPDPDACFGRKTPKKGFSGYQSRLVQDADSEFLVQAVATPDKSGLCLAKKRPTAWSRRLLHATPLVRPGGHRYCFWMTTRVLSFTRG